MGFPTCTQLILLVHSFLNSSHLGVPSSTGLPSPFLCPPPDQSQPPLQPASPLPVPSSYTKQCGGLTERREPTSRPVLPVCTARCTPRSRPPPVPGTHTMALRPSSIPLRVSLHAPPESSLPEVPDRESDRARAVGPTVARLLATAVTHPSFESAAASALVAELLDFATSCRLNYTTALVAESVFASPPSVGGECALGTDVLEDKQEDFECLAAAVPCFPSLLLAPEGDPDAPDILTPRSYAKAIMGPYSSQWVKQLPGSPPAFKAHYVARGFSQRQGGDYFQTFSSTPKMTTLQVLLHVAAQHEYGLHSLDFSTAFLQGSLREEIWLRRPPGFTGSFPAGTQWSLRWPIYGLRQVPCEWQDTLRTRLAALGFVPSIADPSLFLRTDTSLPPFYVLVYVEDLVFATADTEALTLVKSELQKRHTCTDLGELRSYLSLQITRYSSPQLTPLSTSHSLSAPPSEESIEPGGPYPELVGCLMYLMTCTRPDLAYPLSLLARYVAPGRHQKVHWDAAKRALHYLCSTSGMGLVLGGRGPVVLTGHADASWVDDSATQRLSQGYTFSLGSGSVSWWSTRSSSVLSSSCEAEIYAGAMAAQELRWLTYLLADLGEQPRSPPVLYVDNKAMIALCREHRLEQRTKHIVLRYFLARELQQRGQLRLAYVATRANIADVFTKALPPGDHERFVTVLGLGYTFSLGSGSVSWRSTHSSSVLSSNCEAEIYAGAMAAQELCWLTYLLTDLGEQPRSPPVLYVDNKAMIALCQELRLEHRTKHITLRYFLAREFQQRGQLRLAYMTTRANTSDIFTKALPLGDHQRFSTVLGLSRPNLFVRAVCTGRRVPRQRPPPVLGTYAMALRPYFVRLRVALPPPPESSLHAVADPESDLTRAASPTDPSFESTAASALVAELVDFAAACCLDYTTALVAESESNCPPFVRGECALGTDVLEDRQLLYLISLPGCFPLRETYMHQTSRPRALTQRRLRVLSPLSGKQPWTPRWDPGSPHAPTLHKEIWLRGPPGFTGSFPAGTLRSLRQPVYGLRQAPREWHDTLRTTLAALGFTPSIADPLLFLRTDTSLPPFYVLMYVDDLVFATSDTEALTLVKLELQKRLTCTDLGELCSYLGLQITRDRAPCTITLTQSHMVHQVLQRFGFQFSSPQPTPLSTCHSLLSPHSDESIELNGPYAELVGYLMYLMTCTRPDLAYPFSLLARYVAPGRHQKVHWDAAKRVLRYLCSTLGMGLVLGGQGPVVLTGHADASWVDDLATQRLSQGYTFSLGSASVSWRSTRSSSVLCSSCEAEIYTGVMAAHELRWLTYLLIDLGEPPRSPPVLFLCLS
ncbi:unnamed protein product [Closterium sp. NIES-53]